MADYTFNLLHNVESRRDAYGFALRPQHLQTYREYLNIHKEEEKERSEKWRVFLEQQTLSDQSCSSEEELKERLQAETTELDRGSIPERGLEGDDPSKKKFDSDGSTESDCEKELQPSVELETEVQLPVEPEIEECQKDLQSPKGPEEEVQNSRESEKEVNYSGEPEEVQHSGEPEQPREPGKEVKHSREPRKEIENFGEPKKEVQHSREPEKEEQHSGEHQEEVHHSGEHQEEVQHSEEHQEEEHHSREPQKEDQLSTEIEEVVKHSEEPESGVQLLKEPKKEELFPKHTKSLKWAGIRISLLAIEHMMSYRVKNTKNKKGTAASSDPLLLTKEAEHLGGEAKDDIEQEFCANDALNENVNAFTEEKIADDETSLRQLYAWKEELEFLVRGGVPKDLRGEVWQAFVGVKARRVDRYYEELLAQESNADNCDDNSNSAGIPRKWKRQIEKDIPRTFPGHPALNEHGRDSLRRLLIAYARHNPSVGYCQAMNFFAGLLLLLMPEENAFWTLVGIIDEYFDGYYTEEMIESQVDQLVFEELMRERFPTLVNHLDYLGVQVAWISGPWFLSIFVNMLPWESVFRVWDVLLFEGNRVMLFRTALALMELYGPALVTTKDAGDAITMLQSLAGSTFDSSQLVFTACMGFLAVNEARLQELREKHRPAVIQVVEERTKGNQVWKDSKGLASKLYSFKHDPSSLPEETNTREGEKSKLEHPSSHLDDLFGGLPVDAEVNSLPDLQEQVVWLKVELCRLLEEKRSATLRAEELETALMEMVKADNRRELSAKIEQLEQEVADLQQLVSDKKEQEAAMLQVLMRVEQEQRITEEARISAEQDAAAQRYAVTVLQEKYEKAMASLAQMEQRVVVAESTLKATLNYESGHSKALSSPKSAPNQGYASSPVRRLGILNFGFGWRDKNKSKVNESVDGISSNEDKDSST